MEAERARDYLNEIAQIVLERKLQRNEIPYDQ